MRRLNLWTLTRHPAVSLADVQRTAGVTERPRNLLAKVAHGDRVPETFTVSERAAIARVARALGVVDPFEPMPARVLKRCSARPPRRSRDGANGDTALAGRARTGFKRFTGAAVGANCWDSWKRSVRMPLTQEVLDHFGLKADPFTKPRSPDERWTCAPLDRCEKELTAAVLAGQYVLVMGPSGGGKTQLVRATLTRLERRRAVAVSRMLAPDKSRVTEYSLVAGLLADLAETLGMTDLKRPSSTELAMRQLRAAVAKAQQSSRMPVLIVEEAHCVRRVIKTWLKRVMEALADGYEDRLAVVLVGQTDASAGVLGRSLEDDLLDADDREWTQRIVALRIPPLGRSLASYVERRFASARGDAGKTLCDGWQDALRRALPRERLVPLAVDKALSDAMRLAHELGDKRVTGQHVDTALHAPAGSRSDEQ